MPYIGKSPDLNASVDTNELADDAVTLGKIGEDVKTAISGSFVAKADKSAISGSFVAKADKSAITGSFVAKADKSAISGSVVSGVSGSSISTGSFGRVEVAGNLSVTGTDNVGITHASQWRITSNHTGAGFLTANWAVAGVSGPGTLGSGMTESSGVFEFPSTGFWLIDFVVLCGDASINRYIGTNIFITNDGGSTFTEVTKAYNNIYYDTGDPYWCSASTKYLFDVDVLADDKIKFHAHAADAAAEHFGHADMNQTYVTFIRLGDT